MNRRPTLWAVLLLAASYAYAQQPAPPSTKPASPAPDHAWSYNLVVDGYILPQSDGNSYASPVFTADRQWLHLEARYNYEDRQTGSAWLGYSFSTQETVELTFTPMIGGVFGNTTGIAPGYEFSLSYKKLSLTIDGEYVVDTRDSNGSFFYSWTELTYSPVDWFDFGFVAQRTKAYHTSLDIQRGFLIGFSHKNAEFTTYVFNAGWTTPTVVLEAGYKF
jgi:hypothetical protein